MDPIAEQALPATVCDMLGEFEKEDLGVGPPCPVTGPVLTPRSVITALGTWPKKEKFPIVQARSGIWMQTGPSPTGAQNI